WAHSLRKPDRFASLKYRCIAVGILSGKSLDGPTVKKENEMRRRLFGWVIVWSLLICQLAQVQQSMAITGTLADANSVYLKEVNVLVKSTLNIQAWGYGGGTNLSNANIPLGGFDPIVSL